jgi:osmotically-inducible protein OsmY
MKTIIHSAFFTLILFAFCLPVHSEENVEEVSDTWLQTKLVTTYTLNRHLSVFDFDTEVVDQVAYLKGSIGSEVQKDLAEQIAMSIDGVREVKNQLKVVPELTKKADNPGKTAERSFGQIVEDLTITASVKSSLLTNQNIEGLNINVDTSFGEVTLQGKVKSGTEKALAERLASNTEGVREVNNNLKTGS